VEQLDAGDDRHAPSLAPEAARFEPQRACSDQASPAFWRKLFG